MLKTAFILAAGLGTRMRPLTNHTAKPLLYYKGERLIERHLHRLAAVGFENVVINCSWSDQQLRLLLGDGRKFGIHIQYSCEDNSPLETASGLLRATELLERRPFLLINGDIWTNLDLQILYTSLKSPGIVLVDNPPHNPAGDFALSDQGKVEICGHRKLTYAGIGVFTSPFIQNSAESGESLGDTLRTASSKLTLHGYHYSGTWLDIGSPSSIRRD